MTIGGLDPDSGYAHPSAVYGREALLAQQCENARVQAAVDAAEKKRLSELDKIAARANAQRRMRIRCARKLRVRGPFHTKNSNLEFWTVADPGSNVTGLGYTPETALANFRYRMEAPY